MGFVTMTTTMFANTVNKNYLMSWQSKQLHTAFSYLVQANTARVIFSWNDNDPTTQDGSDAMYHTTNGRGSASLNLLGGLPDPPPEPADTRSFTFRVNNVCVLWCLSSGYG